MMEFKPRNGYTPGGFTDPKKKNLFGAFLFLIGIFGLMAVVFGWWSILLDAGIVIFLLITGRQYNKEKGLDK